MAPKKADATPPPPTVDTSPYGAFVNLRLDAATLEFSAPGEGILDEPKTQIEVVYSSEWAPLKGEVKEGGSGTCNYAFNTSFRWDDTHEAMLKLINTRVKVHIMDPASNCSLGSCELDLLPFGLGQQEVVLTDVIIQPSSTVAEGALYMLVSGMIPALHISLTHRGATDAPDGEAPPAADGEESQAASLPEPKPFCFIAEEEREGCNVLELQIEGVQSLPAALPGVCATAKDGKAPGKVAFSVALKIAEGVTVVLPSGSVQSGAAGAKGAPTEGSLVFEPASARVWISKTMTQAMQYAIEDGDPLQIEIARYLSHESLADPAWEYYHAVGGLAGVTSLQAPGSTSFTEELSCWESFQTSGQDSILPAYEMPAGKAKPIEDAPAAGPDGSKPCAWKEANTSMSVTVKFARPVLPPWSPPKKPERTLTAVLPQRSVVPHATPTDAKQAFKSLISDMAASLMSLASAQGVSGGAEKRAAALAEELRRTGKDIDMMDALRKAAVHVSREQFNKSHDAGIGPSPSGPDEDAKTQMQNDLFAILTDQMSGALSELGLLPASAEQVPGGRADVDATASASSSLGGRDQEVGGESEKELARLAALASECETLGLFSRAETLHQQRLLLTERKSAAVWVQYGSMLMRAAGEVTAGTGIGGSGLGRAEECFRVALNISPDNLDAKQGLAAVLLHQGCFTDPLLLNGAEVVLKEVVDAVPDTDAQHGVASAMLWLIASHRGDGNAEAEAAKLKRLEAELSSAGHAPAVANSLVATAKLLVDLGLPALSTEAVRQAPELLPTTSSKLAYERAMLMARGCSMLGDAGWAMVALKEAAALAPAGDLEPDILAGHIHYASGNSHAAAVQSYYNAMMKSMDHNPSGIPLRAYLQMGQAYLSLGHPDYARDAYRQACLYFPNCASVWLGVAMSHIPYQEYREAELALAEANMKDPEHPLVWGNMALIALLTKRYEEADISLKCAMRFGLSEPKLTGALAKEYVSVGQYQPAVALLRASLAESESVDTQLQLLDVYAQMGDLDRVQAQVEVLKSLPLSEEQAAELQRLSPNSLPLSEEQAAPDGDDASPMAAEE